jgi:hypothetical protein
MIEGTVILILGTTLGVVFESTLESLLLNFISNDIHTVLTLLFGFIGLLIAGLFIFYEREIQER